MRITQNNFYNTFINDQQSIKEQLNRLNQQISSGTKIKYGYEDPQVFAETLRLDYEETTLNQAVDASTDAQNFANNIDSVMFQFTDALTRFKTLLIQAANGSNADANYYAISNELKSLKEHFVNLGNSSINGRYLFSGNKLDVKPLDEKGNYYGNGEELKAVVGAGVEVPYNIPGKDLFFGEDNNVNRSVMTNVALVKKDGSGPVSMDTTLEEITGPGSDYEFTVSGRKSDGTIFQQTIDTLTSGSSVADLLNEIKTAYGDQVDVSLVNGYIQLRDKREGNSLLDFHMVGSYADENNNPQSIDFVKSNGVSGETYADNVPFEKLGGNRFRGNMPQIVLENQSFATNATKLSDTTKVDLAGKSITISVNGTDSTFSIDNTTTFGQLFEEIKNAVNNQTGKPVEAAIDHNGRIKVSSEGLSSFSLSENSAPPVLLFNTNDALTVDDPKHDFFASIDAAIEAVENGLLYPDGKSDALARNPGIENAIARIDHVISHVDKEHTKIGAMSNSLKYAVERNETLKINVQTLRSDILDTDIGEASMKLSQLSLNFQAMMATVAKVQNLSLVNYI
ncbi:flagellar hook-associated protein FlgL [Hydrogenimonas sp. SS33]|uniref:flagellar hook-associated protein FlgL n=1 Tax=Hydrogenimonas leucolamina TaxID=2954236 RepID=UPI00336BFC3B